MLLKRDIIDELIHQGINKFILIGENVLNYHASDDCYYQEWFEDIEDGWIVAINFREHVLKELVQTTLIITCFLVANWTTLMNVDTRPTNFSKWFEHCSPSFGLKVA